MYFQKAVEFTHKVHFFRHSFKAAANKRPFSFPIVSSENPVLWLTECTLTAKKYIASTYF